MMKGPFHRRKRSLPARGCSGGEFLAALGAAAGEDLAAVGGGHSLAEAVLLGTLALLGLVSADHRGHILSNFFPLFSTPGLPGADGE